MALSAGFIDEHIALWRHTLKGSYYSFRWKWPSRIFRHDPLQSIAIILKNNELLSRNGSEGRRLIDAAAQEIVNNNTEAHDYARFYFRPRTPTQFRIEGIMKPLHMKYGTQAPMLGMMVFDARKILQIEGVQFSTCNMQRSEKRVGNDEEFFRDRMDFEKIYHLGGINGDYSILAKRCAEILLPSPFNVTGFLQHIICRSNAERETLLYLIGDELSELWREKIIVSDDMKVFERRHTYVESVQLDSEGIVYQLSPQLNNEKIKVEIKITNLSNSVNTLSYVNESMFARPPNKLKWRTPKNIPSGNYIVEVKLENRSAYKNNLQVVQSQPF